MDYNIYIKLTNGCNLKCKHCYNEIMGNHNSMSKETLNNVIMWLKEFRQNHPTDIIDMSLHGGEPMLYNLKDILYLLDSTKDLNLRWCVTTNLVYRITNDHIKIFKQMIPYDIPMVMTSYDFGDLRFMDTQESIWKNNIKLLQINEIEVQPIICVTDYVVKNVSVKDFFNFLDENHIKRFNLERITETGRAIENKIKPTNLDQNKWLLDIYKEYEKRLDLICPLFESVENSLKGIFLGCRARKCMQRVITINPNGLISACPNMANKSYGSLKGIDENKHCELVNFEKQIDNRCLLCQYYQYCNGDCSQLKWDNIDCPGMRTIYEYLLGGN